MESIITSITSVCTNNQNIPYCQHVFMKYLMKKAKHIAAIPYLYSPILRNAQCKYENQTLIVGFPLH